MTVDDQDTSSKQTATQPRRRLVRRLLGWSAVTMVLLLVAAELTARFYLGLGDPPLSMADPDIEYLSKPGHYHRFGRRIFVNEFSMRSGPLTRTKTDPAELRVMVVGDSVINGGALTDDSELATALLQMRLREALHRPVYVGNISAGSWGPPNQLAYFEKYGLFDADCLVVVLSSHDYADAPDFKPTVDVHPSYPSHRPPLALQEAVTRYLLPRLTHSYDAPDPGQVALKTPDHKDVDNSLSSLRRMIELARSHHIAVLVAMHAERGELTATAESAGHAAFAAVLREANVEPIELGTAFKQSLDSGQNPYRDDIHPNTIGQKVLAEALYLALASVLESRPAAVTAATIPSTR